MGTASIALALKTDAIGNDPNQQWVQILPSGQFHGRDGRGPWKVTNPDAVIEATRQYAGKNMLPVDYEHQIDLAGKNGQPAPAAGWIKGLKSRSDGIWGLVEWTDKAAAFLKNKEYKYLSPVMAFTKNNGEVIRILRAALTNNPALEMTALAKSEDTMTETQQTDSSSSSDSNLGELIDLLGLDEEATLEDVTQATKELLTAKNSAESDPSSYVPIGEFKRVVSELNAVNEHKVLAKVDEAIDQNLIPASLKDWGISMCRHNAEAFEEFLKSVSVIYGFMSTCQTDRLTAEERALLNQSSVKTADNEIYSSLGLTQEDIEKYGER